MKMQGHRLQDLCVCSTWEETSSFWIPAQYINKEQIKHMISMQTLSAAAIHILFYFTMDEPNFITQEQQNYKS